jgi:hypothetical protein
MSTYQGNTIINQAVEAVAGLINALGLFSSIYRGPLGTADGLCFEVGPSRPEAVYMDKNKYIPIDITINGKHENLLTITEALNTIHQSLTMRRSYPSGATWEIVDITTATEPQIIGREDSNQHLMASSLLVKVATKL